MQMKVSSAVDLDPIISFASLSDEKDRLPLLLSSRQPARKFMRFTKSLFLTRSGAKLITLHLLSISHHCAVSSKVGPKPFCSVLYNGFITSAACTKIAWKRFYCHGSSSELLSNMEKSLWRCNILSIISKNSLPKLLSS